MNGGMKMKTTVKRITCIMLLLCLTCSSSALAEKRTLTLYKGEPPEGFLAARPDVRITLTSTNAHPSEMDMLLYSEGLDAAVVHSANVDMAYLKENGVLYDMSESAIIREAVGRMYPAVQSFVTDDAGRIVAFPYSFSEMPLYWLQDAWDAAGLTEADVPHSYTELLDFLERWLARAAEHPEKQVCVSHLFGFTSSVREYDFTNWLMELLRYCWEYQQRFAGQPVHYDDPQFYALAERTRAIGMALYKSEPRGKKRQNMLELFTLGAPIANDGREYGVSHAMPLRLTRDQPALLNFGGYMWVMRADAPHSEDALALIEAACLEAANSCSAYTLYADYPAGSHQVNNRSIPLVVSQGWLDDWRSFDGTLVSYPHDLTGEYKPVLQFFAGELTAKELAQALNTFVTVPGWEHLEQNAECK